MICQNRNPVTIPSVPISTKGRTYIPPSILDNFIRIHYSLNFLSCNYHVHKPDR